MVVREKGLVSMLPPQAVHLSSYLCGALANSLTSFFIIPYNNSKSQVVFTIAITAEDCWD